MKDTAGNVSTDTQSIVVDALPAGACTIVITNPVNKPALITSINLVGGNYTLQATSTCHNTAVTLTITSTSPATTLMGTTNGAGVVSFTTPLADGMDHVVASIGGTVPADRLRRHHGRYDDPDDQSRR